MSLIDWGKNPVVGRNQTNPVQLRLVTETMEEKLDKLRAYISKQGLKYSRQREAIAEVFFETDGHISVDDLLRKVRESDDRVSQATIYRTMRLLIDCGLADARQFLEGHTLYEPAEDGHGHHDHLICIGCGKIVEFVDNRIEELQEETAKKHGFIVTSHKMELYGKCKDCG